VAGGSRDLFYCQFHESFRGLFSGFSIHGFEGLEARGGGARRGSRPDGATGVKFALLDAPQ
jgi:hypothetical protein